METAELKELSRYLSGCAMLPCWWIWYVKFKGEPNRSGGETMENHGKPQNLVVENLSFQMNLLNWGVFFVFLDKAMW